MSLNIYWCELEGRIVGQSYEPPDPGDYIVPAGYYVAPTRGKAKWDFLKEWSYPHNYFPSATDVDEFKDVRCHLLVKDVGLARGPMPELDEGPWDDALNEDEAIKLTPEPWKSMWLAHHNLMERH